MKTQKITGLLEKISKKALGESALKITSEADYLKYYELEEKGHCLLEYYRKKPNTRDETEEVFFSPSQQRDRSGVQQYHLKTNKDDKNFETGTFKHFSDLSIYRSPIFKQFNSDSIKGDNEEDLKDYVFISGIDRSSEIMETIVSTKKHQSELYKKYRSIIDDLQDSTIYAVRKSPELGKLEIKKVVFSRQKDGKWHIILNDFSREKDVKKAQDDFAERNANHLIVLTDNKKKLEEFLVSLKSRNKLNPIEVGTKTNEFIKSANQYAESLKNEEKKLENSRLFIKGLEQEITIDNLVENWMLLFKNVEEKAGGKRRKTKKSRKNKRAKTYRRHK